MNNKLKIATATLGIVAVAYPNIYAASQINYNIDAANEKYKIILDGQSYQVPDSITYNNGKEINLEKFKESLSGKQSNTISYSNGTITYNGGVSLTKVYDEYVPLVTNVGILNSSSTVDTIKNSFEKYQLLMRRKNSKESYEKAIEGTTDENILKEYRLRVSTYAEDIARMEKIQISQTDKTVLASIPYIGEKVNIKDEVNITQGTINTIVDLEYYLYSLVFRDLRLNSMKYKVDSNNYIAVPNFNMNTYTYTIKLPESTPDNATISTKSVGYMDAVLAYNKITGYDTGLQVKDDTIQLVNGMGTAKVKNIFNVVETYGKNLDDTYTSNPQRTYTINFTKYDYLKGDLDKNGVINANDAAIALDLYKNGNVTAEDLKIGDMDNDGVINANDAAMILDIYKNGK